MFEETQKNILKIRFISSIILNFLRLRDLNYSNNSTYIIDKVNTIKGISVLFLDILQLNVISMLFNSLKYYKKFKEGYKYIIKNRFTKK